MNVLMFGIFLTLTHFLCIIVLKIRIRDIQRVKDRFMCKIGIIKEIDKLGRIVIPKELRSRYGLSDKVEIVATKDGILLKSQEFELSKIK